MVIRVRWRGVEPAALGQQVALALGSLLAPLALLAFTLAFWAFAAEAQWTGTFLFESSLLAHWQIWLSIAGVLLAFGNLLGRLGTDWGGATSVEDGGRESSARQE